MKERMPTLVTRESKNKRGMFQKCLHRGTLLAMLVVIPLALAGDFSFSVGFYCMVVHESNILENQYFVDLARTGCDGLPTFHVGTIPYIGMLFTFSVMTAGDMGVHIGNIHILGTPTRCYAWLMP